VRYYSTWLLVCLIVVSFGFVGPALAGGIQDDFNGVKLDEDWIRFVDDAAGPQGTLELKDGQLVVTLTGSRADSNWGREGLLYGPVDFTLGEVIVEMQVASEVVDFEFLVLSSELPPEGKHPEISSPNAEMIWTTRTEIKTASAGGPEWIEGGFSEKIGQDKEMHTYRITFTPEGEEFFYTFDFDGGVYKYEGLLALGPIDPEGIYISSYGTDSTSSGKTIIYEYLYITGPGVPGTLAVDASAKLTTTWGSLK